jgi:hypothetical protein
MAAAPSSAAGRSGSADGMSTWASVARARSLRSSSTCGPKSCSRERARLRPCQHLFCCARVQRTELHLVATQCVAARGAACNRRSVAYHGCEGDESAASTPSQGCGLQVIHGLEIGLTVDRRSDARRCDSAPVCATGVRYAPRPGARDVRSRGLPCSVTSAARRWPGWPRRCCAGRSAPSFV